MKKRLSALLLSVAMLCGLAACGKAGETTGRFTPGTYTGEGQGFGGPIEARVTLSAGKIESVVITENSETPGIGAKAVSALPDAIVAAQSVQVDAIGGATLASQGVIEAVTAALESAGADTASLTPINDTSVPSGEQALDVDVVVVGAGGAGMTAGIAAARAGKRVVILEKAAICGGSSVRSIVGLNAAKTDWQDDNGWNEAASLEKTLSSAAETYPELAGLATAVQKEYDSWKTAGSKGCFDSVGLFILDTMIGGRCVNDIDLVETLAKNSADAVDWLDNIGANLHAVGLYEGASVKRIHRPVGDEGKIVTLGPYLVPILEQTCIDNGVEIICNAPVTELLMDGGKAVGVRAEGYTVNAKAVIIATGGFAANLEMVAGLKPELDGFITTNAPGCTGDGVTLAQAVGAATVDMNQIQVYPTVERNTSVLISEDLRRNGAILVNAEGRRFCDELGTRDAVSAAVLQQTGGCAWLILDQRMADASSDMDDYISWGCAIQGKTPSELAGAMDIPEDAFNETISGWNAAVSTGVDQAFGRTSAASLDTPPLYAIKVAPGVHYTMGGVKINTSAEVIDTDGNVIPGLFAAGEVTGGIHGADLLDGNAVTDFLVFGRIAGEAAAAYAE